MKIISNRFIISLLWEELVVTLTSTIIHILPLHNIDLICTHSAKPNLFELKISCHLLAQAHFWEVSDTTSPIMYKNCQQKAHLLMLKKSYSSAFLLQPSVRPSSGVEISFMSSKQLLWSSNVMRPPPLSSSSGPNKKKGHESLKIIIIYHIKIHFHIKPNLYYERAMFY